MALVAYDNSDSSEFEDEDNENTKEAIINNKIEDSTEDTKVGKKSEVEEIVDLEPNPESSNLFNFLPQPSTKKPQVIEEDDEFLHKKETSSNIVKPKAKITVPSLNDFRDVESSVPIMKPKVANGKKSGLLSMLPQPKNGVRTSLKSMIPHVLTKNTSEKKKEPPPTPAKKPKIDPKPLINDYSDESDNGEMETDFFSINKPVELPVEDGPLDIDQNINNANKPTSQAKPFNIESYFKPNTDESNLEQSETHVTSYPEYTDYISEHSNFYVETEAPNNDAVLDEEAILKLCGARGKRRREDIEIVDVNQQEILGNAREMLMKGLMDDTTKRVSASKKKGNEPTSQQKRKHQITYLAHQAKANEAELQNQWANNRMSKRQTQSKYGF